MDILIYLLIAAAALIPMIFAFKLKDSGSKIDHQHTTLSDKAADK